MANTLCAQLHEGAAGVTLDADWSVDPLVAGMVGRECEFVTRNRGGQIPAARMLSLGDELWAWVSYREEWERPPRTTQQFSFRSAGLTVFFGYANRQYKAQVFRAEWSGWAIWNGTDYGYQAGGAAHPHWQFDALESLTRDASVNQAADDLRAAIQPQDFSPPSIGSGEVRDLVLTQQLSRIHFASAALWWQDTSRDAHVHSPQSETEIQVWVGKTLKYVTRELTRLKT